MNIKEVIHKIVDDRLPVQVLTGKVTAVNTGDMTVDVSIQGRADRLDVRLRAVIDGQEKGILIYPKTGSYVLVGLIDNRPESAFVVAYSEVEKIRLLDLDRLELGGDNKGGLVISQAVADDLNTIKQDLNQLKQVFAGWQAAQGDGGSALKLAVAGWASSALVSTNKTDLENQKVTHGD